MAGDITNATFSFHIPNVGAFNESDMILIASKDISINLNDMATYDDGEWHNIGANTISVGLDGSDCIITYIVSTTTNIAVILQAKAAYIRNPFASN